MNTQTEPQYIRVEPKKVLLRENFNPRVKPFTEDIKPSILAHGVRDAVEAIDNGDGTYTLNAQGHRRHLALTELINEGHKKSEDGHPLLLPLKIVQPEADINKLRLDIITLNTGKPLEMIEEARVYGAIVSGIEDKKIVREKAKELSAITGKSVNAIMNLLSLLEAGPVITKLIESGKASASLAIELFLAGSAKGDWTKVETELVNAVADAATKGKTKASKKDVSAEATGETPEQKSKREDKESKKKDNEENKARMKELLGAQKRLMRFSDFAVALDAPEGATGLAVVLPEVYKGLAGYLYPDSAKDLGLEGPGEFGDCNAGFKRTIRTALASEKEVADGYKASHKEEIAALKLAHKAEIDKLNIDLKAANAKLAAAKK